MGVKPFLLALNLHLEQRSRESSVSLSILQIFLILFLSVLRVFCTGLTSVLLDSLVSYVRFCERHSEIDIDKQRFLFHAICESKLFSYSFH